MSVTRVSSTLTFGTTYYPTSRSTNKRPLNPSFNFTIYRRWGPLPLCCCIWSIRVDLPTIPPGDFRNGYSGSRWEPSYCRSPTRFLDGYYICNLFAGIAVYCDGCRTQDKRSPPTTYILVFFPQAVSKKWHVNPRARKSTRPQRCMLRAHFLLMV